MRTLYTLLWYLALPLLPLRLWWRGWREPGYREHVGERFGRYDTPFRGSDGAPHASDPGKPPVIWVHAVSLGETRAAAPLIERLQRAYPQATILLTHMTATGRAAGKALPGERIAQAWLPYDTPFAVRAFLRHFRPRIGLLMETELWPNLVAEARRADIPVLVVNARLSARSAAGYARVAALTRPLLGALSGIAAQSAADAERLAALGAHDIAVTGNLKFDVAVPAPAIAAGRELRRLFGEQRPVWLAGSTRDGEEALILDALASNPPPPEVLTVILPRHPQRFDDVAALLRQRGFSFVRRSEGQPVPPTTRVVLGDTMGEMLAYCAAADLVFVGGSLLPLGGQNLIEPIAVGAPVLVGPHTFNFTEATAGAIAAGAALRVADGGELIREVRLLLEDAGRRSAMSEAGRAFCATHRGALERLWSWLEPRLDARVSDGDAATKR